MSTAFPIATAAADGAPDWAAIATELDGQGWAVVRTALTPDACGATARLYGENGAFRNRVRMAQHGFGQGEYKYFAYPLPPLVAGLRESLYAGLAPLANRWQEQLGAETRFPAQHASFLARCYDAGQRRPTPLLLRYGPGDYNCLHQDVYGELVFPLQATILLSRPEADFTGGEFVITEQRPRAQSRVSVVPLAQGDAVIFGVRHRPLQGKRGAYRVSLRHGVSAIRSGARFTLGIILHDAS